MNSSPQSLVIERVRSYDRPLTVAEVSKIMNVSGKLIYKLVARGRIPSFKVGGAIRFDPFVLAEWLKQRIKKLPTR